MNFLSVKIKQQGVGVGNMIKTDCMLRSFGLAARPGLHTAEETNKKKNGGEKVRESAAKGQEMRYGSHSYCTSNQPGSAALFPPVSS